MILNHSLQKLFLIKSETIINVLYRPPNGQIEPFETFLNNTFSQGKVSAKAFHIADNFNLNLLDHVANRSVQNFLSLVYQNGMIPTINKPTRVSRKTATAIDHILTSCFTETVFKTAVFKSDISDHFPICFLVSLSSTQRENKTAIIKEYLTQNQFNHLRKNYMKPIGKKQKVIKI